MTEQDQNLSESNQFADVALDQIIVNQNPLADSNIARSIYEYSLSIGLVILLIILLGQLYIR